MYGKFISIEGIDGSGKSTVISYLKDRYPEAIFVREPGTTEVGKAIRSILLEHPSKLELMSEFFLFVSSFIETSHKVIKPALLDGKIVIADRWFFSTKAYQEYAFGRSVSIIDKLCELGNVSKPDLNIILSLPFSVALERKQMRSQALDNIESRGNDYLRRVHLYYDTECPGVIVDATLTPFKVAEQVISLIEEVSHVFN